MEDCREADLCLLLNNSIQNLYNNLLLKKDIKRWLDH